MSMDIREEIAKTMYVFATQGVLTAEKQWAERPAIRQEYLLLADALMPLVARIQAEARRRGAEIGWDKGARHVYQGGRCKFAQDGDPCPYNPYRADRLEQGDPS